MTQWFGAEHYNSKKAIKGDYKIKAKYSASTQQKISGPTFLKVTIYSNYSCQNETKRTKLISLKNIDDILDLGEIYI